MFIDRKICILLVGICMFVHCQANYDDGYFNYNNYARKLSSYIRTVGEFISPESPQNDDRTERRRFADVADMYTESITSVDKRNSGENSCCEELRKCWATKNVDIPDNPMSQRIVNMLLSRATVWQDQSIFKRYLVIETSEVQEEALKKFRLGQLKLREIDSILNGAIKNGHSTFVDHVMRIYTWITYIIYPIYMFVNYLSAQREIILLMIIVFASLATMTRIRWNFRVILLASIQLFFTITFLISWWKVSQRKKDAASYDAERLIECQWDTTRWISLTWFGLNNDCDNLHEAEMKDESLSEESPEELFAAEVGEAVIETLKCSGKLLFWLPQFVIQHPLRIVAGIFAFLICGVLPLSIIILASRSLYKFIKEPRRIYSIIESLSTDIRNGLHATVTKIFRPLNNRPAVNDTQPGNHHQIIEENNYYKISCGLGKSVILKTKCGVTNLEKNELEAKINLVLGKSMEIEKILGRIATRDGEQITVTMKLEEDKAELIEKWEQLSNCGIVVDDDIILMDQIAIWHILGLTSKRRGKVDPRKISINGEGWIWNGETRRWVQHELVETSETIGNNVKGENLKNGNVLKN